MFSVLKAADTCLRCRSKTMDWAPNASFGRQGTVENTSQRDAATGGVLVLMKQGHAHDDAQDDDDYDDDDDGILVLPSLEEPSSTHNEAIWVRNLIRPTITIARNLGKPTPAYERNPKLGHMFTLQKRGETFSVNMESVSRIHQRDENMSFDMIDHVPPNIPGSSCPARLFIFVDREAVIRIITTRRSLDLSFSHPPC